MPTKIKPSLIVPSFFFPCIGTFNKNYSFRRSRSGLYQLHRKRKGFGPAGKTPIVKYVQDAWNRLDKYWPHLSHQDKIDWGKCVQRGPGRARSNLDEYRSINLNRMLLGYPAIHSPPDKFHSRKRYLTHANTYGAVPEGKEIPVWASGKSKDGSDFDEDDGDMDGDSENPWGPTDPPPPPPWPPEPPRGDCDICYPDCYNRASGGSPAGCIQVYAKGPPPPHWVWQLAGNYNFNYLGMPAQGWRYDQEAIPPFSAYRIFVSCDGPDWRAVISNPYIPRTKWATHVDITCNPAGSLSGAMTFYEGYYDDPPVYLHVYAHAYITGCPGPPGLSCCERACDLYPGGRAIVNTSCTFPEDGCDIPRGNYGLYKFDCETCTWWYRGTPGTANERCTITATPSREFPKKWHVCIFVNAFWEDPYYPGCIYRTHEAQIDCDEHGALDGYIRCFGLSRWRDIHHYFNCCWHPDVFPFAWGCYANVLFLPP